MSSPAVESRILLVGCEDDTSSPLLQLMKLLIYILVVAQNPSPNLEFITNWTSHQIILNKMQTLLIGKAQVDLTGSKIVCNKPLTVVSGHECGNVPSNQTYCDHASCSK